MKTRCLHKKLMVIMLFVLAAVGFSSTAYGKIAGYNVLLVHGFHSDDLIFDPSDEEILARRSTGDFWQSHAEGYLNWSGAKRVEGGISQQVFEQAKEYSQQGLCEGGCVLVTHSTGDLVARHFLANQEVWFENAGLEPLNIVATIDLAGAGGGTDLADIAVGAANSESIPLAMKLAAGAVIGLDLDVTDYDELGVVLDLTYSGSRNLSMEPNDIPRLRFSAKGGSGIFAATKPFISGADDGVIPASSSCGASSPQGIYSCSSCIDYDGKRTSVRGPSGLLYNHFPVLMSDNYAHMDIFEDEHNGPVTFVYNDFKAGLDVDFETYTKTVTRKWWQFWIEAGTWQYVTDSNTKSMSGLIYDTFNE